MSREQLKRKCHAGIVVEMDLEIFESPRLETSAVSRRHSRHLAALSHMCFGLVIVANRTKKKSYFYYVKMTLLSFY